MIKLIYQTQLQAHSYSYSYLYINIKAIYATKSKLSYSKCINKFCSQKKDTQNNQPVNNTHKQPVQPSTNKPTPKTNPQQQTKSLLKQIEQYYPDPDNDKVQSYSSSSQSSQKYSIISRNYKQTKVPGLQTRKYTNMNKFQQDIIQSNKFDLLDPQVVPKTGSSSAYALRQSLTQISLGSIKIKSENQVFLSEVDPYNVPADLDVRFDEGKVLKVVGKETDKIKIRSQTNQNYTHIHEQNTNTNKQNQVQMTIQPQTIQHRSIKQHMQSQFGVGVKGYGYSNVKSIRRWDIFLTLLSSALLIPIFSTFKELEEFYTSSKAIEEERMKQIRQLKQRSYHRVLFENQDFNNRVI